MKKTAIVTLLLTLGCTSMQQQSAQSSQPQAPANSEFKNLKVLPRNISHDDLIAIMRTFTRSLGVQCNYCHVVTATTPKTQFDFPSDAKEEKRVARVMMQMTTEINTSWMEQVEAAEEQKATEREEREEQTASAGPEQPRVSCWTCHRGKPEPEMPPPPPAAGAAPAPKPST